MEVRHQGFHSHAVELTMIYNPKEMLERGTQGLQERSFSFETSYKRTCPLDQPTEMTHIAKLRGLAFTKTACSATGTKIAAPR